MKNEIIARFFKYHASSDDKLQINFAWPYSMYITHSHALTNTCIALYL